jgi:outer membrane lipoprotein-sorting protein
MKKLLAIAVVIALLSLLGHAQSADDVIKNYLKAANLEKAKAIKTLDLTGKMTRQGMEMQMKIQLKRPNKVWTEITLGPQKMTQGFDGQTAWAIIPQSGSLEPQVITGPQAQNLKDQFDLIDDPFLVYKEKGSKIELISKEEIDGKTYYKIELTKQNGEVSTNFFDAETFLMHKTAIKRANMGQEVTVEFLFDDYKPVGGVMIAHKITTFANGNSVGDIIFTSITANTEIDDSIFPMPKIQK